MKVITEEFDSINSLLTIINSRENNSVMENEHSSEEGSKSFTGSKSYGEAVKLIRTGYVDILKDVKEKLAKVSRKNKQFSSFPKSMPKNSVMGYIPNVPNAIRNIPESMINRDTFIQKRKTLSVVYSIEGNCDETTDFLLRLAQFYLPQ